MKKLTAILLAILMLILIIASCGGNDETTTTEIPTTEAPTAEAPTTEALTTEAPTTETPTTEIPTTEAPTTINPDVPWSSKTDIRDTWSGKTLNVACTTWYDGLSAPWCTLELAIKEGEESGFGTCIDNAVLEKQGFIENTYGVKLNFINAGKYSVNAAIDADILAKNINYYLTMPRSMTVQSMVAAGYLYDLNNREFIDFRNTYYDQNFVNSYTAYGHTFFVTGNFSTIKNETASVLFVNKDILGDGSKEATEELYNLVKKGEWTFDRLVAYCETAYSDNGNEEDIFRYVHGLCCTNLGIYFNFFGSTQAGVSNTTGQWELAINNEKVDDIITAILSSYNARWLKYYSGYGWGGTNSLGFEKDKILFLSDILKNVDSLKDKDKGIVPFPMLNKEQGRYYVPTSNQLTILMCIPKTTQNREMSEYFMDVLCWTGEDYTMKAYIETKKEQFKDDADIEMITEYIIPNISYDAGECVEWDELLPSVKNASWADGENKFDEVYASAEPDALKTIAEWNAAWGGYTEE